MPAINSTTFIATARAVHDMAQGCQQIHEGEGHHHLQGHLGDMTTSSLPLNGTQNNLDDTDTGAVMYITAVLVFYSLGIVVMIIKYLKTERKELEEEAALESFFKGISSKKMEHEREAVNRVAIQAFHTLTSGKQRGPAGQGATNAATNNPSRKGASRNAAAPKDVFSPSYSGTDDEVDDNDENDEEDDVPCLLQRERSRYLPRVSLMFRDNSLVMKGGGGRLPLQQQQQQQGRAQHGFLAEANCSAIPEAASETDSTGPCLEGNRYLVPQLYEHSHSSDFSDDSVTARTFPGTRAVKAQPRQDLNTAGHRGKHGGDKDPGLPPRSNRERVKDSKGKQGKKSKTKGGVGVRFADPNTNSGVTHLRGNDRRSLLPKVKKAEHGGTDTPRGSKGSSLKGTPNQGNSRQRDLSGGGSETSGRTVNSGDCANRPASCASSGQPRQESGFGVRHEGNVPSTSVFRSLSLENVNPGLYSYGPGLPSVPPPEYSEVLRNSSSAARGSEVPNSVSDYLRQYASNDLRQYAGNDLRLYASDDTITRNVFGAAPTNDTTSAVGGGCPRTQDIVSDRSRPASGADSCTNTQSSNHSTDARSCPREAPSECSDLANKTDSARRSPGVDVESHAAVVDSDQNVVVDDADSSLEPRILLESDV